MKAKRRDFLKFSGILGASTILTKQKLFAAGDFPAVNKECVLIPSETAGPFPLDLTENPFFFRQDVREDRTGVQLNMKMRIIGLEDCEPMQNVRVHIWHCDKDGNYSGYGGETGLTYLRGWQMTDSNGEVEFITIVPGWYPGRVCHIHFQVYVSTMYAAISQLTYDVETKNAIYLANPELYTQGVDPVLPEEDGVFADGYEYQLSPLTPNTETGGYDGYLEVTVQGSGTTGIGYIEKETARHVEIGQNYPNPFNGMTTVPFLLKNPSEVSLELWDPSGRKLVTLDQGNLPAGKHEFYISPGELGLPSKNYLYQVEVRNSSGTYRVCKMMTSISQ